MVNSLLANGCISPLKAAAETAAGWQRAQKCAATSIILPASCAIGSSNQDRRERHKMGAAKGAVRVYNTLEFSFKIAGLDDGTDFIAAEVVPGGCARGGRRGVIYRAAGRGGSAHWVMALSPGGKSPMGRFLSDRGRWLFARDQVAGLGSSAPVSSRLRILPVAVIGRESRNSIYRGYLYCAICCLHQADSSSTVTVAPGLRMT